ncbi:ABC transporter substrate-binding protein [Chelativorans salis]|uniref:ABC transporter substrate-binding protein n=1 Tax=Chelativorans salis TaxID=2978478 RepID=A0ABT2LM47_9HYPH|nr:ABC transporter substrate-binding protein [Chelativorans sp. EGI FJ00035]MCT7375593.1 ABC transporter substrate-binding protein [Chelativorans sp. EGI FJ00035]
MRKLLLIAAASLALATAASAQTAKVSVTAIVEHPALDAVRDGVRDGLEEAGYREGENLEFAYESAQGNPATAAQIAREFVGDAPDVIVPISTPSAQAAAAATRDIPVVFSAVTDPLAAGLVESNEAPGGNVTGVSDLTPIAEHVALIRELVPSVESIGFVYNPGEANSVALLEHFRNAAEEEGLSVVEAAANKSADVQAAARSLVGKADAIYVPTDNTVVSALEALIAVAEQNDLPLISGDTDSVERGTLASIGFDYYQLGKQTAEVVVRVLEGEDPGTIPVTFASGTDLVINRKAAEAMDVTLPDEMVQRASKVIE